MTSVLLKENTVGYGKDQRTYKYAWFPCRCSIDMHTGKPSIHHCQQHWVAKDDPPLEQMVEACQLLGLIPEGVPDEQIQDFVEHLNMATQFRRARGPGRRIRNSWEEQNDGTSG